MLATVVAPRALLRFRSSETPTPRERRHVADQLDAVVVDQGLVSDTIDWIHDDRRPRTEVLLCNVDLGGAPHTRRIESSERGAAVPSTSTATSPRASPKGPCTSRRSDRSPCSRQLVGRRGRSPTPLSSSLEPALPCMIARWSSVLAETYGPAAAPRSIVTFSRVAAREIPISPARSLHPRPKEMQSATAAERHTLAGPQTSRTSNV